MQAGRVQSSSSWKQRRPRQNCIYIDRAGAVTEVTGSEVILPQVRHRHRKLCTGVVSPKHLPYLWKAITTLAISEWVPTTQIMTRPHAREYPRVQCPSATALDGKAPSNFLTQSRRSLRIPLQCHKPCRILSSPQPLHLHRRPLRVLHLISAHLLHGT